MILLANAQSTLDPDLRDSIYKKIVTQVLSENDFQDGFKLFGQMCNHLDDLQFEVRGFDKTYQFIIGDKKYAVLFKGGKCETYAGEIELPQVTFQFEASKALEILTGQVLSSVAHMNGDVKIKGIRNDAIRFQTIFELFFEEFC